MYTPPVVGTGISVASLAFRYAAEALECEPITSPVDFISGPGAGSKPLSLINGNTGAFTQTASV